jgi:hypothetical protein
VDKTGTVGLKMDNSTPQLSPRSSDEYDSSYESEEEYESVDWEQEKQELIRNSLKLVPIAFKIFGSIVAGKSTPNYLMRFFDYTPISKIVLKRYGRVWAEHLISMTYYGLRWINSAALLMLRVPRAAVLLLNPAISTSGKS